MPIELNDKQKVAYANWQYKAPEVGQPINLPKVGTVGYVSEVIDNKKTGEQAYIITPKKLPKKPTASDLNQVVNVTILYRGSTEPGKGDDWVKDWINTDLPIGNQVIGGGQKMPPAQLKSAAQTLDTAMNRYKNATFDIYGHSLGSMNGQYAISDTKYPDRIHAAYLYEGPNIHSVLNDKQQRTAETLKNRIFNYIDDKDYIAIGYTNASMVGMLIRIDSKKATGAVDQHMWGGYQFDKSGNIRTATDTKIKLKMAQTDIVMQDQLKALTSLATKLTKSGGHLSASEQIYLESSEVLIIVDGIAKMVESGFSEIIQVCQQAIKETETHWIDTVQRAQDVASHLSYYEVMDALTSGGATKARIVDEPVVYYEEKIAKAEKTKKEYQALVT
ncbi:hypothetical protein [Listeria booriae]|nr:hypothetical protein [Listeria booriae]MBC2310208.1 hypothetical protein [Listeria booriae]